MLKAAAPGEVCGALKTASVEKLELQQICSSTILGSTPVSIGCPLFLPKLLQNIDLCGQQLDEIALKYNIVSFLPFATNIETGYGEKNRKEQLQ